jgi:hypothetical protein
VIDDLGDRGIRSLAVAVSEGEDQKKYADSIEPLYYALTTLCCMYYALTTLCCMYHVLCALGGSSWGCSRSSTPPGLIRS